MQVVKRIVKILSLLLLGALIGYIIAWWPVIDKLIHWCEYYPESLADCRSAE